MSHAYYNEIDPYAAQWLQNLIDAGHIAYGDVDTRSVEDVTPRDLNGYTQCHFFAGIGVWSHALRMAGWPDTRPVWTGSCPCQPFSAAGKRKGAADERHLWPAWSWLIQQCKPDIVFGEQVASKDGRAWLDLVQTDLEDMGFAVGAGDICAAGVGAPHIRQRLYFVADSECRTPERYGLDLASKTGTDKGRKEERERIRDDPRNGGRTRVVADAQRDAGEQRRVTIESPEGFGMPGTRPHVELGRCRVLGIVGNPDDEGLQGHGRFVTVNGAERRQGQERHEPSHSFWTNCDWLPCIDGKARPVEPGTFPLADGITGRVGRLRAYGNAIVAPLAKEFIGAYLNARS